MGKRRTASRRLLQDGELLSEIEDIRHTLQLARVAERSNPQGLASEVPRLERRLEELTERAAREAVLFVCQTIPADDFDELRRIHPPTAADLDRWREQVKVNPFAAAMPEFNWRTMGPDLLEKSLVEPKWSRAEIDEWWAEASEGERLELWALAKDLQVMGSDVPFSVAAIGMTGDGGKRSATPASEESLSQSS